MERQTHQLSEVVPSETSLFEGEFSIDGDFRIHSSRIRTVGDLYQSDVRLSMEHGKADYSILGRDDYFVDWTTYDFRRGLSYFARLDRPFIELYFQLEGCGKVDINRAGRVLEIEPGDSNLMFLPSMEGTFSLNQDSRGSVFEVVLSVEYVTDLAGRFPHLFDPFLERMHREEPFWLSREHLHITPGMLGIIHRIRQSETVHVAGSLFLEAQILELLALYFAQLNGTSPHNGIAMSRADTERIHEARSILLSSVQNPPTLSQLARSVGTNEFKLKRGFKAMFGTSPYAYLLDHKLELARTYLLDSRMTVAEIAYRVGYRDPAHLTNAFRKRYGVRPSDLR